jgi:hypothetical protein
MLELLHKYASIVCISECSMHVKHVIISLPLAHPCIMYYRIKAQLLIVKAKGGFWVCCGLMKHADLALAGLASWQDSCHHQQPLLLAWMLVCLCTGGRTSHSRMSGWPAAHATAAWCISRREPLYSSTRLAGLDQLPCMEMYYMLSPYSPYVLVHSHRSPTRAADRHADGPVG